MISRNTLLDALKNYNELNAAAILSDGILRLQRGNFEYVFSPDAINYLGDGSEFLALSFADEWTAHGDAQLTDGTLILDGASWLSRGSLTLGGQDFQIEGRAFESADDMLARRKIFELYTSADLNISLYSSGAGKNLDLLVNAGGTIDLYSEPAILEREYQFKLKFANSTLTLAIDGTQIYSAQVTGLNERRTFEQVLIGASVLHSGAAWRGSISDFKIFDGFAEA